jgi:hypothetical protein
MHYTGLSLIIASRLQLDRERELERRSRLRGRR